MKKSLGAIVLLLVVVTLAYGQNQKATNRGAPGQVPLGGMIAVMPTMHANAWQPPATGAIKDGFMRADGATVSAQNVTDGSQFPAGTQLPNMVSAFPRGATTSAVAATGSDTRDISHNHAMAHTHDTSVAHTHGYGFSHTHGTDSQLGTISLAHAHRFGHTHNLMNLTAANELRGWTFGWPETPAPAGWDTTIAWLHASQVGTGTGGLRAYITGGGPLTFVTNGINGVFTDGTYPTTETKLTDYTAGHSHSTTSQTGTTGTTSSQTGTTFTSGAASNATTTSGGSASLDIKPAYLNTVWVIRVK